MIKKIRNQIYGICECIESRIISNALLFILFIIINCTEKYCVKGVDEVKTQAALYDKDPSSIVYDKLNIPKEMVSTFGQKLKKIYTNSTFSEDLASYVSVSIQDVIVAGILISTNTDS